MTNIELIADVTHYYQSLNAAKDSPRLGSGVINSEASMLKCRPEERCDRMTANIDRRVKYDKDMCRAKVCAVQKADWEDFAIRLVGCSSLIRITQFTNKFVSTGQQGGEGSSC